MLQIHAQLNHHHAINLWHTNNHALRHIANNIANINLAADNVVRATVQQNNLDQPNDNMLNDSVKRAEKTQRHQQNQTIVNNATAAQLLTLHQLEHLLNAQKHYHQININHQLPLLNNKLIHQNRQHANANIVEQHIKPTKLNTNNLKQHNHRHQINDINQHRKRVDTKHADLHNNFVKRVNTATNEHNIITHVQQNNQTNTTNATACTNNHNNFHKHFLQYIIVSKQ